MLSLIDLMRSVETVGRVMFSLIKFLQVCSFSKILEQCGSQSTWSSSSLRSFSPRALSKNKVTLFWISWTLKFPILSFLIGPVRAWLLYHYSIQDYRIIFKTTKQKTCYGLLIFNSIYRKQLQEAIRDYSSSLLVVGFADLLSFRLSLYPIFWA